jgi:membrane associated rhomboid family serine protease
VFIPLGTNLDTSHSAARRPYALWAIVALNLVIHAVVLVGIRRDDARVLDLFDTLSLSARGFLWWQPISYQFLHDPSGITHVASNMIFLLAFGRVVEGRLGHLGFATLYLVGGALAGLLQIALTKGTVIGASGSVSVVAGAFLALHPRGSVHGFWLLPPMRVRTSAAWLLGLYAAIDLVNTFTDAFGATRTGIGTVAHLGGLVFGLGVCVALLGLGVLPRNDFDLFFLMRQWKRRRDMRAATAVAGTGIADGLVAARVRADAADQMTPKERTLRTTLAAAHRERDYVLCAQLYRELLQIAPTAAVPAEIQLDIANELARAGDAHAARAAYARFVERFRDHRSAADARLMLAVIELRRLGDKAAARATLDGLNPNLLSNEQSTLARTLREEAAP